MKKIFNQPFRQYLFLFSLILFCVFVVSNWFFVSVFVYGQNIESNKLQDRFWQILIQSPRRGVTFERVFSSYLDVGAVDVLLSRAEELVLKSPDNPKVYLLLGLICERCGDAAKAVEAYERAVKLEPNDPRAFYYLGEILIAQGKLRDGIDMLELSLQKMPDKTEIRPLLILLGKTAQRLGNQKKSAQAWTQLESLYPNNPDIVESIAEILKSNEQINDAIEQYEAYLRRNKVIDYTFVRFKLAVAELKMQVDNEFSPINDYAMLIDKLNPNSWLAEIVRKHVERYFVERDQSDLLINFYQDRLKKHPIELRSILELAALLKRLNRLDDAVALLENCVDRFPLEVSARLAMIDIFVMKNRFTDAVDQYKKIDELKPADKNYLLAWGSLVLKTDDADRQNEAVRIWTRLVDGAPTDPVVAIRAAEVAAQNNIVNAAEKFYLHAIKLNPKNLSYREYLGLFYYKQAEIKKAVQTIQSIAEINSNDTNSNEAESNEIESSGTESTKSADVDSIIYAASLLVSIHAEKEAFELFAKAAKLAPRNQQIQKQFIEMMIRRGEIDNAVTRLIETENLIMSDDEFDTAVRNEVRFMIDNRKLDIIVQKLSNRATTQRSTWRLAIYYLFAGKSNLAIKTMDKILYDKNFITTHSEKLFQTAADLYEKCGENDKATKILNELVSKNNTRQITYLRQLAYLQIKLGNKQHALETVNQVRQSGKMNTAAALLCADIYSKTDNITEAKNILMQTLQKQPNNTAIIKKLAELFEQTNDFKNAIELSQRLFNIATNIETKLDLIKTITEYYLKNGQNRQTNNTTNIETNIETIPNDRLRDIVAQMKNFADKREKILCTAVVFETAKDFVSARRELESVLILPEIMRGEKWRQDKLLLQKLVSVAENLNDYPNAVMYQEAICTNNPDASDFDKLFLLYDANGDREKCSQLFMRQILTKTNVNDQINMIDRMISREEYEAVDHVLAFLEIHEEWNWEISYRQIAVAAYLKRENLQELVRNFRKQKSDVESQSLRNIDEEKFDKILKDELQNGAWILSGKLPTTDFTNWDVPNNLVNICREQEIFMLTFWREKLKRNENYIEAGKPVGIVAATKVTPPKPFYRVKNFEDAKFFALCWLLKFQNNTESNNDNRTTTPDNHQFANPKFQLSPTYKKFLKDNEVTEIEAARLKVFLNSNYY
ncbi:MAG: tetratricopeptide repeat protein [Planctomycetaceae bacterium]|jgi:tetratricopeptide (TPR) repeat protein|nr:tetratricopeptide repeat protein [Planctomycetaceae bacterium]